METTMAIRNNEDSVSREREKGKYFEYHLALADGRLNVHVEFDVRAAIIAALIVTIVTLLVTFVV